MYVRIILNKKENQVASIESDCNMPPSNNSYTKLNGPRQDFTL